MSDSHSFRAPRRATEVYAQATAEWTLAAVEHRLGFSASAGDDLSARWLRHVLAIRMVDLDDDDLSALLTRGLHLPLLLPLALGRLRGAVESLQPPSETLILACGQAAGMLAGAVKKRFAHDTTQVLQQLLRAPWPEKRDDILEAVYAALNVKAPP